MKGVLKYIFLLLLLMCNSAKISGQNEYYGISKEMYGYVQRFRFGNNNSSIQIADSLYQISQDKKDARLQCVAYLLYCEHYYYKNDIKKLYSNFEKLKNLAYNSNNTDLIYEPWGRIISYYLNNNEFSKAYEELKAMQKEALVTDSKEGIGLTYRNFGNFYQSQNNSKLAVEQYNKGAEFYTTVKDYKKVFLFYCSATFSSLKYDLNLAEKYSDEAMKLTPKYGNRIIPAIYSFAVATEKGDMLKAERFLNEINELKKETTLKGSNRIIFYKYYIIYSIRNKNLQQAKSVLDSITNIDDSYNLKEQIAEAEGNYKLACELMKKRFIVNDSISNKYVQEQLANMLANYNTSYLESENVHLKMHSVKVKFVFCFILFILIVVAMIIYLHNRRQTIKKLRIEHKITDEARQNAEKADNLKSVFLQNMSHEIRTPLNAIIGFTDLLNGEEESTLTDNEKKEFKSIIHSNSERLLTLINDILDLSKLESGNYSLKYNDVFVNGLCSEVSSSVKSCIQDGVELIYNPCPGYENFVANIDGQRVGQIITNFLTNASKYTSSGSITLTYDVKEKEDSDMVELKFSVTDTGSGIPLEKRNAIFQRFEKLNSNKAGSGLGLNICMRLAVLMKGMVSIDPEYITGSRFILSIPAKKVSYN